MKAFVSWSGGKDCALASWRVMQDPKIQVTHWVNMLSDDGEHSRSHRLTSGLLKLQAECANVKLVQRQATWNDYETQFKIALADLKKEGLEAGIFGDIDLVPHRDWVERVCAETGLKAILPIWQEPREKLLQEFMKAGFKSKIVVTNAKYLGEEWLGREIDGQLIQDLVKKGGVDLCGENGEYHSFVYDGPFFRKPVPHQNGQKQSHEGYWFLDILSST